MNTYKTEETTAHCLHLAPAINLPNGRCHTHTYTDRHTQTADSLSDDSWRSMTFVRGSVFPPVLTGCLSALYCVLCMRVLWIQTCVFMCSKSTPSASEAADGVLLEHTFI